MSEMTSDETDEPGAGEREEDPEAAGMQRRVDELGEHIDEAVKKAQVTREQARPGDDRTLKEDIGDWTGTASDDDDPSGAVDEGDDSEH